MYLLLEINPPTFCKADPQNLTKVMYSLGVYICFYLYFRISMSVEILTFFKCKQPENKINNSYAHALL